MSYRRPQLHAVLLAVLAAVSFALVGAAPGSAAAASWNTLSNPINPGELTKMPWGSSSYWLQPWRSSLTTRSAASLQSALGINFNVGVGEAMSTARLLHDAGIRRARLEISWNHMSYSNPSQLLNQSGWAQYITAMRVNGIRPLILLNGDPKGPTPMMPISLTVTTPAVAGATTVTLDPVSAAKVVPGLTGFDEGSYAARVLITSVDPNGVATLSQPLPASLAAGPAPATTFAFAPFAPPYLADGSPNPRFQQTLAGYLTYAKAVCQFVASVYGSDNFDVEVWNENQVFLNESNYFNPVPDPGSTGSTTTAVLQATIAMLRNPANGLTHVQVGDGFSSQSPWTSGTTVPVGTNAIDRHPYAQTHNEAPGSWSEAGIQPVNPQGLPLRARNSVIQPIFTPTFRAFFPEYPLSGIQTETLIRDLSSTISSNIQGTIHGANTAPAGGTPPATWITEDNLDGTSAMQNGLPAADMPEFQAKAALRFYLSYASTGAQAIDLYSAKGINATDMNLISPAFFSAVDANPSSYPASLGGPTMQAVGRMSSTLAGAQPIAHPRQLTLTSIAQYGNNSQFTGNGTSAYPSLYDRDVLTFFPWQVSQHTFVAGVYVMTRDLTHYYTSHPAPGMTPYDMPAEAFRLTIGNVNGATASVSLSDPLTGTQQPATIISRTANQIVVQLAATDSPRMLAINDGGSATWKLSHPARRSLTLKAPAKVSSATALRRGIRLVIGCGTSCPVRIMASPSRTGAAAAHVYGRSTAHPAAASVAHITVKLNSSGRAWLRTRTAKLLRVTAVDNRGDVVAKVIKITHAHR